MPGNTKQRQRRKEMGLCYRCGKNKPEAGRFQCRTCLDEDKERDRVRREGLLKQGLCVSCGRFPIVEGTKRCRWCGENVRNKNNNLDKKRRSIVLRHYGNKCACCGEDNPIFLCIDHINNNGNEHRKEIWGNQDRGGKQGGKAFIYWIIQHGFPDDLQILCFNCNMGKHLNGGVCPHQTEGTK